MVVASSGGDVCSWTGGGAGVEGHFVSVGSGGKVGSVRV